MVELRFAVRAFSRAPLFLAMAVLLIALATGLNTALFSLLYASVLKPFPYHDADRLVMVSESERGRVMGPLTPANFDDVRRDATSFEGVTGHRYSELELSAIEPPQRITALHVLESFFPLLGVEPVIGRTLDGADFYTAPRMEDGLWSVGPVAVLGHRFWQRQFGASRDAVGATIRLNDKAVTIVGVMPGGFDALWRDADLYLPWILPPDFWSVRPPHVLPMLARLKPGRSIETASSELGTIYARLAKEYPETNEVLTATVEPLRSIYGDSTRTVSLLFAGALMVLVVACSNLAGLLATRVRSRGAEIALRRALGASSARVARQLLVESAILSTLGGAAGIGVAIVALRTIHMPLSLPFTPELSGPVLAFTVALLALTALVLGLAPAWLASRTDLSRSLREVSRGSASRSYASVFIVVQIAIALGLVSASGLLLRSLGALRSEALGFDPEGVRSFYVALPKTRYPSDDTKRRFRRKALEELRTIPGVVAADSASHLPVTPMTLNLATSIEGRPLPRGSFRARPIFVSHDLLPTLRIPIVRGRGFDERDRENSPWVVVVNERLAADFWPGADPIGNRIRLDYSWAPDAPMTVIGVVSDVKQESLGGVVQPAFYILHEQFPQEWFYFALRTETNAQTVVSSARARLSAIDPNLPMTDVRTMDERVEDSLAVHRSRTRLAGLYGAAALSLASLGLYGTLASVVGQRDRELVIRMALGATRGEIARLVLREGLVPLAVGIFFGLVIAVSSRRFVGSLLYEIEPSDPVSLVGTTLLLTAAGLLAACIPAHRATRLEIATRLRQD